MKVLGSREKREIGRGEVRREEREIGRREVREKGGKNMKILK